MESDALRNRHRFPTQQCLSPTACSALLVLVRKLPYRLFSFLMYFFFPFFPRETPSFRDAPNVLPLGTILAPVVSRACAALVCEIHGRKRRQKPKCRPKAHRLRKARHLRMVLKYRRHHRRRGPLPSWVGFNRCFWLIGDLAPGIYICMNKLCRFIFLPLTTPLFLLCASPPAPPCPTISLLPPSSASVLIPT